MKHHVMSDEEAIHELSYYTLSKNDPDFIHQYCVDAYAAQTASETSKPIQVVFALVGLYLHLEKHYSGKEVQQAHTRLAKHKHALPSYVLPSQRGAITASDVMRVEPGPARDAMIQKWMASVWEAWRDQHYTIAAWIHDTLAE